ncbi:hypothetical protein [Paraburkholderia sp. BCC1885]|uniref:hypothetical protein n=1 Tax=Paraburkholderia sp. BCC1885 TaxID=2562669 RepID=UPI0021B36EFE|nr:hypothetical protein [Paraburkholderia sp. BCC1885]
MRSRSPLPESPEHREHRERPAKNFSTSITALKAAPDRGRAELIRDVVDAFRRLYGSVLRFVQMFANGQDNGQDSAILSGGMGSHSFNQLLSLLAEHGKTAGFGRFQELRAAIEEARSAEHLRDAIFSDAHSNDPAALRKAAAELARLDATFVGLCVEHVLEQHARAPLALSPEN